MKIELQVEKLYNLYMNCCSHTLSQSGADLIDWHHLTYPETGAITRRCPWGAGVVLLHTPLDREDSKLPGHGRAQVLVLLSRGYERNW